MSDGLPSKQTVNAVGGRLQAREIAVGTRLWTLDGSRAAQTTVTGVTAVKARAAVEVVTSHAAFTVAGGLLLATPSGWIRAEDAPGSTIAWTHPRKLCRERLTFRMGYAFGYFVGATCADGTVGKNYVSLVVNDEAFATRYARCLTEATAWKQGFSSSCGPPGTWGGTSRASGSGWFPPASPTPSAASLVPGQRASGPPGGVRARLVRHAAAVPVPSWSLPSSGRRQTRSRKRAAAMTPMPAITAAPA